MRLRVSFGLMAAVVVISSVAGSTQAPVPGVARPGPATGGRGTAPTTGTGAIRGRVIAADTGLPLPRAQVRLAGLPTSPNSPGPPSVLTDDEGRYELLSLPAGRFTLSAVKIGYVSLSYGQRRAAEAPRQVDLSDGQVLDRIDVTLPRGGVIVTVVADDFGGALAGVLVSAQQYRYGPNGVRNLLSAATATTDDRGEARLAGLAAGEYFVSAGMAEIPRPAMLDSTRSGQVFARTFFPGTAVVDEAQRVTVAAAAESRVTLALVSTRTARISGVVRTSAGGVPDGLTALSMTTGVVNFGAQLPLARDGSFVIPNAQPGDIVLNIRPAPNDPDAPQEYANFRVKVAGEDITGLVVTTSRGATVRGRLTFDTGDPPANLRPNAFRPVSSGSPASGNTAGQTTVNDDWTFDIKGLVGSYYLRLGPPPPGGSRDWILKSVFLEGKDVVDTELDLSSPQDDKDVTFVLTQKRTTLTGTVTDARGTAVRDYGVVVFAENKERWGPQSRYIGAGRPDQNGNFRVADLPPGQYLAVAVESLQTGEERDPDLLERVQRSATRFALAEGESKTMVLRIVQ